MTKWIRAKVLKIKKWSPNLFSLILKAKIAPFIPGQYNKLLLNKKSSIQRAYSYVNSSNKQNLEFYILLIPNGKMTPFLYSLNVNEKIYISKESFGFFTIREIPKKEILWMFSTGTAIGPYLSILQEKKEILRFKKIVLIHAIRYFKDLNYLPLINNIKKQYGEKFSFISVTSREKNKNSLFGRIPKLIENNSIENKLNLKIQKETSHIMLCGNPNMVKDTIKLLYNIKNMRKHLRRKCGEITSENYW
ncbi:FAD-binding oxidoreductase [Buchnera aphidicola (Mindarus keteleerifoliae)]|uniref:FAD-binding oxidoreductase n=1 Tax=Buchnera aphidicola TaxID=9 RepID=UPI0031B69023